MNVVPGATIPTPNYSVWILPTFFMTCLGSHLSKADRLSKAARQSKAGRQSKAAEATS